jgi:hypothetical protein
MEKIEHEGYVYYYEYRPAKNKVDLCLATKNPKEYCNGWYLYSDKDPGSSKCFVIIKTNNPNLERFYDKNI